MTRNSGALLLAASLIAAVPSPKPTPSAPVLLRSAMNAPRHVSYVGEVQVLHIGRRTGNVAIFRVEHKAPDMTRRWYAAPQELYGDSIVTHGNTNYSIDVKRDRVVVSQDADDDQALTQGNYGLLTGNYEIAYGPDANVDGRRAYVILLNNKFTGQTTMRLQIDAKTHLVLERQEYASNGSLVAQMRIEQIRYTRAIPDEVFDIPANLKQVDAPAQGAESSDVQGAISHAGFAALVPKYLPQGFVPVAGGTETIKNVATLHLLYSDGIRTFSLFQNEKDAAVDLSRYRATETKVANYAARYVEDGPTTLLAWSDGARHFALVGDLGLQELEKIGASVLP
jgi:negative regulator of sigma E activity